MLCASLSPAKEEAVYQNPSAMQDFVRKLHDEDDELGAFRQAMVEMRDFACSVEALLANPNSPLSRGRVSVCVVLLLLLIAYLCVAEV